MQPYAGQQCPAAVLNPVLSALPQQYLTENPNLRLDLTEVATLHLTKFLNLNIKPPNKTIPLLQTSLSTSLWGPETPVLKAHWATVLACGHRFSKHPKSGSAKGSLHEVNQQLRHGHTSLCASQSLWRKYNCTLACWYRCLQRGFGMVTGSALALFPWRKEQWLYGEHQHLSRQRSLRGPGLAHKSQAVQEGWVSCFYQAIHLSWAVSKASEVNPMLGWGKQISAGLYFPAGCCCCRQEHLWTGQNLTNGDLQLLSAGVSWMKQSKSKK